VAGVDVEHVEAIQLLAQLVELDQLRNGGIAAVARQAQGFRHTGKELGTGAEVAAGEEDHLLAPADEFFGEVVNDPLGSSIAPGRKAVQEISEDPPG
jgi:hypothetical protein